MAVSAMDIDKLISRVNAADVIDIDNDELSTDDDINYVAEPTAELFHASKARVRGILGPIGCTDGITEYLSPSGWRRIDDYDGEKIAQWTPSGAMSYVTPTDYIDGYCEKMWLFENKHSLSMALSDEHRVAFYNYDDVLTVKTADEIARKPSKRRIPTHFEPESIGIGLSDSEIMLRVMIAADGHYPIAGNQCVITVRKNRKKDRIRELLSSNDIKWKETVSLKRPTEQRFTFVRPVFGKPLSSMNWYEANQHELSVLLSESLFWDGLADHVEKRFYTAKKEEADIVQFAACACGYRASISVKTYENENWQQTYTVQWPAQHSSIKNKMYIRGDNCSITRIAPLNNRKYCFVVPSSFWIARRNGRVFITGNSGKSVACTVELLGQAMSAFPFKNIRKSRYCVIRNTYPELISTTIKTFRDWMPEEYTTWNMAAPITCTLEIPPGEDGIAIHSEFVFLALDKPKDVKKIKSLELTGVWINEACEIPKAIVDMAYGRTGRYPKKSEGGAFGNFIMIMDTNPPDDDNWWHNLAEEEKPEGYKFWHQPPAVLQLDDGTWIINPKCENLRNQPKGAAYWLDQISGKTLNWIQNYLQGKYGSVEDGKPVYPEWMPQLHLHDGPLIVNEGLPLILGWDFGRTPSVVICQLTMAGQFRVLDEKVSVKMGIIQFANKIVKPFLANKYNGMKFISFADPAGVAGQQTDDTTCFQALNDAGFPAEPTITNAFLPRRESVVEHMTSLIDGQPGFLVSSNCKVLRRGFNGRYKYRRMQVPGEELFSESPVKNEVSHPHDALQYACLGSANVDIFGEATTTIDRGSSNGSGIGRTSNNWRTI